MPINLYNTLSRKKEPFAPLDPKNVRMYVCGPTVYDYAHIGNARPVVVFDTLFRLLRHVYGADHVTYVRNVTDVDDKIIKAAADNNEPIAALTTRTFKAYEDDMAALGALGPTHQPRCTDTIPQMVALIETLIAKGFAYAAEGHVLFHVPAMAEYGQLSRRSLEDMIAGARVEVAPYKKHPADFVLWKPSTPDQPGWDSPWGRGRPGWHIECSAMAKELLGVTFDIHGGGQDLIFPHHENEIAQSRCSHDGAPLARVWMHNGFVQIGAEKMSKSLGNYFTVHELLEEDHRGEAIRLALLSAHYRQPLDITREAVGRTRIELNGLYQPLRDNRDVKIDERAEPPLSMLAALEDDLNTPLALSHLHEIARELNKATGRSEASRLKQQLISGGRLLGLLQDDPDEWFQAVTIKVQLGASVSVEANVLRNVITKSEIEAQIAARAAVRKDRNFAEADRIRKQLLDAGVVLEDKPDGTTKWRWAT